MSISLEEANDHIQYSLRALPPVQLPLESALGCVMAEELSAERDQPPFHRSPYDGYALRAENTGAASRETPVALKVVGQSFAGKPASAAVKWGEAVRIMTGSMIPCGADCVIPQEETDEGDDFVNIYARLSPFDNYCRQGEDFHKGERLAEAGMPVTAAIAGVAASAGRTNLLVFPKPEVALISTGDELQEACRTLGPGQIYNSNGTMLSARLKELRIPVTRNDVARDTIEDLLDKIDDANAYSDFLILSGGVSAGKRDLVPAALERLGARPLFHGVAIKPGMPAALMLLRGKPVLALSGNPFACSVTFELLARPAMALLASNPGIKARKGTALLAKEVTFGRPIRRFQRGILHNGSVFLPGSQRNGQLRTLIGCNCLVELPRGNGPLPERTPVCTYLLEGDVYGTDSAKF